jgi:hypothetical protein
MAWIWLIGSVVLAGLLALRLGLLAPPHATTLIRIREGKVHIRRGSMLPYAREQVADALREAGVSSCFIAVVPGSRVVFSRTIPSRLHQRLRNVILNQ